MISISQEEINYLLSNCELEENEIKQSGKLKTNESKWNPEEAKIFSLDYFNSLKIKDIDYLILYELNTNKILMNENIKEKINSLYNKKIEKVSNKIFHLRDKVDFTHKLSELLNRSEIYLG